MFASVLFYSKKFVANNQILAQIYFEFTQDKQIMFEF